MKFLLRVFCVCFLAFSCSQKPAQIKDHSRESFTKKTSSVKYSSYENKAQKTSLNNANNSKISSKNKIEIVAGDTIFGISRRLQIPLRDLITTNNLTPPYNLNVGDSLIIPAAKYHEVKSGETIYAIARTYNMKIGNLVEMNNLKEPYVLKAGDKIKISTSQNKIEGNTSVTQKTEIKKENKIAEQKLEQKSEQKTEPNFVAKIADKFNKFSWPVRGTVISKFGPKSGGLYNDGINIKAKEGAEVKASEDGVVAYVGNELKGYGNLVIIKHSGGWITAYAHLQKAVVAKGSNVKKGQKIALVGSTGNVTSPQLYFGLRKGRDAVNPQNYLK